MRAPLGDLRRIDASVTEGFETADLVEARAVDPHLTHVRQQSTRPMPNVRAVEDRIHVGDDEVLLDDSRRYAARAVTAGVDARLDVWMGMPHGFPGSIGKLKAAAQALDAVGAFLSERLQAVR